MGPGKGAIIFQCRVRLVLDSHMVRRCLLQSIAFAQIKSGTWARPNNEPHELGGLYFARMHFSLPMYASADIGRGGGKEFPDAIILDWCRDRQITWLSKYHYLDGTIVHIVVELGASI